MFICSISRHGTPEVTIGPGPAAYADKNYDLIKKRTPAFTVKLKQRDLRTETAGPGPRYYPKFNTGKSQPMYTFGIRHSECAPPAVTDLDE